MSCSCRCESAGCDTKHTIITPAPISRDQPTPVQTQSNVAADGPFDVEMGEFKHMRLAGGSIKEFLSERFDSRLAAWKDAAVQGNLDAQYLLALSKGQEFFESLKVN